MENVAEAQKSLREIKTRGEFLERFLKLSLGFWALFAGLLFPILAGLILLYEARLAIEKFGFIHFLTYTNWDPVAEDFGAATMIFGTVVSTHSLHAHRRTRCHRHSHIYHRTGTQLV
jgi:phosphate transport system permease protein